MSERTGRWEEKDGRESDWDRERERKRQSECFVMSPRALVFPGMPGSRVRSQSHREEERRREGMAFCPDRQALLS